MAMKRRSGQHGLDKRKQQRFDVPAGPIIREGVDFTQLELLPNQLVTFKGSAVLEVTTGCITVFGALITPDTGPIRVHAPAKLGRSLQLAAVATADTASPYQPSSTPALAVLHPLQDQQQQQQQLGYAVTITAAADAVSVWQVPEPWAQAVGDLSCAAAAATSGRHTSQPLCVAVAGSKGSGKSAFARLMVNTLLSQGHRVVAYLDLDPGQPEFTPPGLLSLQLLHMPVFGPAHLQHQKPLMAFFQGDSSPQSEPGRYLQAAQALLHRYNRITRADLQSTAAAGAMGTGNGTGPDGDASGAVQLLPPLIINTPGWITGLGLDLLAEVLRCAGPTHVVQLQANNSKKNLPAMAWWLDGSLAAATAATGAAAGTAAAAAQGAMIPFLLQVPSVSGTAADPSSVSATTGQVDPMLSAPSGDPTQTQAAAGCSSSAKGISAAAARNLSWLAWAERVAAANAPVNAAAGACQVASVAGHAATNAAAAADADANAFLNVSDALTAAIPLVGSLNDLHIELLHAQVPADGMPVVLNGAVVGLSACSSNSSRSGGDGCSSRDGTELYVHPKQEHGLPECLALGLVRSVDGPRGEVYLLTDLPDQQLRQVGLLQLGKLELPDKLLECGSCASPYQGLFCLTSAATGACQIKSRNNLVRTSQLFR